MSDHRLKIEPVYYDRLRDGSKTHEVRLNDRDYQVGDTITVGRCEDRPSARFGACLGDCSRAHTLTFEITHVLPGDGRYGVMPGYCVLSLQGPRITGVHIHIGGEADWERVSGRLS